MIERPFRYPLADLRPLFLALEKGYIDAELATRALVDHEPTCSTMMFFNSYDAPLACDCAPKITVCIQGKALSCQPDGTAIDLGKQ